MPSLIVMDLRQLQAFMAVVEHGGFTAAAKATHTVQSNISTHVARLEKELDTTLIDRATGQPTEEGNAVVMRARRIQNEITSLHSDVASLRSSPRGTVRFGMIGTTARWLTPLLVEELAVQAPDVQLLVADGSSRSIELSLLNGQLDLGLLGLPLSDRDIKTTPLFDEEHVVVAPKDHALAKEKGVCTLKHLAEYPLLLGAPGTSFRQEVDESFHKHGLTPKPKLEVDGLRLLASLAFQGFGVAVVPATAASEPAGQWVRIPVEDLPFRTVGLAVRRRGVPTMAAQVVVQALSKVIQLHAGAVDGINLVNKPK